MVDENDLSHGKSNDYSKQAVLVSIGSTRISVVTTHELQGYYRLPICHHVRLQIGTRRAKGYHPGLVIPAYKQARK